MALLALQVPAFHISTGLGFTIHLSARGWAMEVPMAQEADGARLLFHRGCTGEMGWERARGMAQSKPWVKESYRNRKRKEKTPRKKHCLSPAPRKELEEEQALLQRGECCTHTFINSVGLNRQTTSIHPLLDATNSTASPNEEIITVLGNVELSRSTGLSNGKASLLVPKPRWCSARDGWDPRMDAARMLPDVWPRRAQRWRGLCLWVFWLGLCSGCNRNHCGFFPQKWHEAQAAQVLPLAFLQV